MSGRRKAATQDVEAAVEGERAARTSDTRADTICTAARKRVKTVNEVLAPVRQLSVALGGASASAPKYGLLVCSPQTANLTQRACRRSPDVWRICT